MRIRNKQTNDNCHECGGDVESKIDSNASRCQDCGAIVSGGRYTQTETNKKPWGKRTVVDTPFSPLTFNELHAGILGNIGLLCGIGGYPILAVGLGVGAIVFSEEVGLSVITKESWYFIGLLVLSYVVGAGITNLGVL